MEVLYSGRLQSDYYKVKTKQVRKLIVGVPLSISVQHESGLHQPSRKTQMREQSVDAMEKNSQAPQSQQKEYIR